MSLSHEQSSELRQALEQRRGELEREIREDLVHDASELREIDAARARLEEGSYGECMECGQDIGFARLKATPSAVRCIVCQTRFEKTHAPGGRPTL